MIQGDIEKNDLKYPAVTVCPKVSTKYAITERLGNFLDPMNLPDELVSLRHDFLMCAAEFTNRRIEGFLYLRARSYKEWYKKFCIRKSPKTDPCKV